MLDKQPEADRILVAQLTGKARHHAKWRDLTEAEHAAAVGELRELAAGRADLLAEVAGLFEGFSEGELDEPLKTQAPRLCRDAGANLEAIPAWIEEGCPAAVRGLSNNGTASGDSGLQTCWVTATGRPDFASSAGWLRYRQGAKPHPLDFTQGEGSSAWAS